MKLLVFKPFIYGRREPDHHIKFGGSQNIIFDHLRVVSAIKYEFPAAPAEFCPKTSENIELRIFWESVNRRKPASRPTKILTSPIHNYAPILL